MTRPFSELVVGGVLVAPFMTDVILALVVVVLLRPVLHAIGFARVFSHPSIAELSLYVAVLGLLTAIL
jgi:Protein of unknown function (DUF1656)